ncbi:MAG: helix-turn-helix domain-containing protein [Hydrogenophaga sp.]
MKAQPKPLLRLGDYLDQGKEDEMTDLNITKGSANVFADLGFDPQEAQNLQLRSQTMIALLQWFNASGLTQTAAAKVLGVTQPRLNQLLKGKIEIFSLDALVNMATSAGMRVGLVIRPQTAVKVRAATQPKAATSTKRPARAFAHENGARAERR